MRFQGSGVGCRVWGEVCGLLVVVCWVWGVGSAAATFAKRQTPAGLRLERLGSMVEGLEMRVYNITQWPTYLSSNVDLPHTVSFKAVCGTSWSLYPQNLGGSKPLYSTDWYKDTLLVRAASFQFSTVGLCLRPYGVPMGGAVSYERGTPVRCRVANVGCRDLSHTEC